MSTHVEEAFEGVLASGVIFVNIVFFAILKRLLDVPEDVLWQLIKDLSVRASRKSLVICAAQVLYVVVLFALLEGIELAGQDLIPFLIAVSGFRHVIEHGEICRGLIFSVDNSDFLRSIELLS